MHCAAMEFLASIAADGDDQHLQFCRKYFIQCLLAEVRSLRLISVDLERHVLAMTASGKEGFLRFKRLVCYIRRLLLPVL